MINFNFIILFLFLIKIQLLVGQRPIMQLDALLFLADIAFELTDGGNEAGNLEAAKLKQAMFKIDKNNGKCNISLNSAYLAKFGEGMQKIMVQKVEDGIQKDLAKNSTQFCSLALDNLAFSYIYNFGYGLTKELLEKGGQNLGPNLQYSALEEALNGAKNRINTTKTGAENFTKYSLGIEKYSPVKNSPEEASNWAELRKIIAKKGQNLKWAEFAKAKNDTFGSFKDVRVQSSIFQGNKQTIEAHNQANARGEVPYQLGLNHFADYCIQYLFQTNCQSRSRYLTHYDTGPIIENTAASANMRHRIQSKNNRQNFRRKREIPSGVSENGTLPSSIDYRNINGTNYVTEIVDKNKIMDALYGSSAHCTRTSFAFAAASTLEGHIKKQTGKLYRFSAKQCMDCAIYDGVNLYGKCSGGYPEACFQYLVDGTGKYNMTSGIEEWDSYPLKTDDKCQYNASNAVAQIRDWDMLDEYNYEGLSGEEGMKMVLATKGPVAASLVFHDKFYLYSGGVYYDRLCNSANGAIFVTIIGYGTDKKTGMDYWLIKNHWGTDWGENGYARVARNRSNHCLIANDASYPIF